MTANCNDQGRAYEYAWINALYETLGKIRSVRIVNNSSLEANKRAWTTMSDETRELFENSANAAVAVILELEPLASENDGRELLLEFQQDSAGVKGDVRDVVIRRNSIHWEVGLSVKHNHEAVKHCRLSKSLDFGNEWFGIPCCKDYWNDVKPVFDRLKIEKADGKKWSETVDKEGTVYLPLLQAFMNEVRRTCAIFPGMTRKMIEYLIGTKDYYKVVSRDGKRLTTIQTFNVRRTLNKPSKIRVSAMTVTIAELPTELIALKFKTGSANTVGMYLNNGWQLSFRIHNASAKVEPSLKFDVRFIGMPVSILNIECRWK